MSNSTRLRKCNPIYLSTQSCKLGRRLAYEEGDHVGVPGLLRLEVLHGHLPVVAREMPQEDGLHLVCQLKHLLDQTR